MKHWKRLKWFEKLIALALVVGLLLGVGVVVFAAEPVPHWAEDAMGRWGAFGVDLKHSDPDGAITLGEAARLFASLLGLEDGGTEAGAVLACADAGLLDAEIVGTTDPEASLSRETYFVMLARALRVAPEEDKEPLTDFTDLDTVSPWARGSINALLAKGWLNGVSARQLAPGADMSRAGALSLLDRTVTSHVTVASTYLEARGGVVLVSAQDVLLTGRADAVIVVGGARDSVVTLEDLKAGAVSVGTGAALLLTGTTEVERLTVEEQAQGVSVYIGQSAAVGELRLDAEDAFVAGGHTEDEDTPEEPKAEASTREEPETEAPDDDETPDAETPEGEETQTGEPGSEASGPENPGTESGEETAVSSAAEEITGEEPEETASAPGGPYSPVEAVGPGRVVDYASGDVPFTGYELDVAPAAEDADHDVLVLITMTELKPHLSRGAVYGWWTGFTVTAPDGATEVTAAYSYNGTDYGTPATTSVTDGRYAHYFDAARWNEYYVQLTWGGAELTETEAAPVIYKLDFTGVELDLSSLTTVDSPFGKFGTARLTDQNTGSAHRTKLYDDYEITVENKRDENGGYLELTVRVTGLRSHRTPAGVGYWAGFSAAAPDEAGSYKYSAYLTADTARKNFAGKTPVTWESFAEDVDGTGEYGIVQRTNAAREDQRSYWAVLQWYADEEGTVPLTAPEIIHIVLDAELSDN